MKRFIYFLALVIATGLSPGLSNAAPITLTPFSYDSLWDPPNELTPFDSSFGLADLTGYFRFPGAEAGSSAGTLVSKLRLRHLESEHVSQSNELVFLLEVTPGQQLASDVNVLQFSAPELNPDVPVLKVGYDTSAAYNAGVQFLLTEEDGVIHWQTKDQYNPQADGLWRVGETITFFYTVPIAGQYKDDQQANAAEMITQLKYGMNLFREVDPLVVASGYGVVPEPATLLLFGLGGFGLLGYGWKRKSA